MAFEWVIRHQKKALFVLAVVLIVGWGIGGMISSLMGGGNRGPGMVARIAGQNVSGVQIQAFMQRWTRVFPDIMGSRSGDAVDRDRLALAWYSLVTLAREQGLQVSDEEIIQNKLYVYRALSGRSDARLDEAADSWFRERLLMSGVQLDEVLRERLIAERVLSQITGAVQVTKDEAWDQYSKENRSCRVRSAEFPATDFIAQTPEPDNAKIHAWYGANSRPGGLYYTQPTLQIEYAQVMLAKLESGVTVTSDEMKAYYDKNIDLYKLGPAIEGKEAEVLPFPEVKPEIEEALKRKAVSDRAKAILDAVRSAFASSAEATLEAAVKAVKAKMPEVEYVCSPFLTDVQLVDLPGIGVAHADGRNLPELAFQSDAKRHELSPIMSSAEGRWIFRPAAPERPGVAPELAEVKPRVIADLRKLEALDLAEKAAGLFDNDVIKAGPDSFEKLAAGRKIKTVDSPFFRNNLYDAARPDYVQSSSDLAVGKVYDPWVSTREYVAAVVKVIEERPADRAGFTPEEVSRLTSGLVEYKRRVVQRMIIPKRILDIVHYQDLRERETGADNSTTQTPTPVEDY